jgi:two-component system cell cycle sensor histidine kinase PleC
MENLMRTSGVSGAGATRFRVGKGAHQGHANSVTAAVAATAFLAATLFVIYDAACTFSDLGRELSSISKSLAAEISDRPSLARASLGLENSAEIATTYELVPTVDGPHVEAVAAITGRAGAAFALAGLLTFTLSRRRPGSNTAQPHDGDDYRKLASAIPLSLACWSRTGDLIVCNDHYIERLGTSPEQTDYQQAVRQLAAGGRTLVVSEDDDSRLLELHRPDGACLLVDERPLGDGAFMTLVSDITERKRRDALLSSIQQDQRQLARQYHEEKLKAEAASRAKTNFLAHLSHDIRTPLNHIIGFADLMKHETYGPLGDPRYAEYVQSIKASGDHLLASFASILDLAELEGGQKALRQDLVLLDEVIDTVIRRFGPQIDRAGLKLKLGQPSGAVLRGDRLGLTRMLGNIVDNAVRFSRPAGTVTLATYAAEDGVVIEVTDTGIGMGPDRLASLTQPFALGDATFTREDTGPGLGISIARAIAELSGGHIAIDSAPALGTTVAITLPVEPAAAELAA